MINLLYVSSCSACFEWENNLSYYCDKTYTATLNGAVQFEKNTNVFSLFDLTPDTQYVLGILGTNFTLKFKTKKETVCVLASDFGAKGDGKTDDTIALQTAINCMPAGGRLRLEKGVYLTAPLTLKSDMTLELTKDSVILGTTDESRYPTIPGEIPDQYSKRYLQCGSWEGVPKKMHQALIFGAYIKNVTIVGEGTIDGNAQNATWWQNVLARETGRPRLCFLNNCKNVTFHGVTGQNAASWQFHPYFSEDVNFYNISVNAPKVSPNTDGLDPESCNKVNIIGCHFSVGDDCIAIKSGKSYIAKKYKKPANLHVIRNCYMENGHGAITLGSEMSAGVTNLTVNKCLFSSTDRGLRIKTRRGRGKYAVIDGVLFENITMNNVLTPIVINMFYYCCDPDRYSEYVWSREKLPVDDGTPYLGKFAFRNMVCENCHVAASYCDGLPERPIQEITVENVKFTFAKDAQSGVPSMATAVKKCSCAGLYFNNVETLNIKNVSFKGVVGEQIVAENIGTINRG